MPYRIVDGWKGGVEWYVDLDHPRTTGDRRRVLCRVDAIPPPPTRPTPRPPPPVPRPGLRLRGSEMGAYSWDEYGEDLFALQPCVRKALISTSNASTLRYLRPDFLLFAKKMLFV